MLQRSIKSRVTILLPLLATLSCAVLLFIVQSVYVNYLRETIGQQQYQAISLVADEIDRKLESNHALLTAFTASLSPQLLHQPEQALAVLTAHANLMTVFTNGMFLLDQRGKIVAELPLGITRTGFDLSFRDYFRQTITTARPFISDPYISLVSGNPAVMFTAPILSPQGRPVGMFGASVNLTLPSFLGSITTTQFGETGYMFLFSRDRTMILHPDPSRIMKKDIPEGKNLLLDRAIEGFEGFGETVNTRGLHALSSFRQLKYKDWIVGVNYPLDEVYAPIHKVERLFWLLALPVLLLVLGGLHLYLRRMTRPLYEFAGHVAQLQYRQGSQRFFPSVNLQEVDAIGRSFNQMIEELDRRQDEAEQQAGKFRLLFNQAGDPVFICSQEGTIQQANFEAIRILGYRYDELIGMTLMDLVEPGNAPGMAHQIEVVQATGQAVFESVQHTRTGGALPVEVNARLIVYGGEPVIFAIVRDISDRKQAEQLLRSRNDFLLALHETTLGLLQRPDIDSLLEAIVSRAARLMGTEHGYLYLVDAEQKLLTLQVRKGLYEQITTTTLEPGQGVAGRVWLEKRPVWVADYHTVTNRLLDPALEHTHALIGLPLTAGDEVVGVIGVAYTDPGLTIADEQVELLSRFAELASLALHNARLYGAIQSELDERKRLEGHLRHAQRMEAVGRLAGGIAHDFNNVLTVIIGYASMMEMKLDADEPCRVGAERILAAAERAAALTRGLLAFSRRQPVTMQLVDLNQVIRSSSILIERLIGAQFSLDFRCAEEPLPVMADGGQLEQIIMNLVTNARDAMPDGGSVVLQTGWGELDQTRIEGHGPAPGRYAFFSVADSGAGMDEATVQRIYEPFFTTKEVGRGTGLGLAIVYNIVQQHGGLITCQSDQQQGTLFTVHLPLCDAPSVQEGDSERAVVPRGAEVILLAEDNEETRDMTRRVLEEFGYTVIEAADGAEAVAKYQQYHSAVALALLDLVMPKLSGRQLYEQIRATNPQAKVLFTSAYQEEETMAMLPEGVPFLGKPYKPGVLLRKLREVLLG